MKTWKRKPSLIAPLIVLVAGSCIGCGRQPAVITERPNIVLIVVEDWSWPHAGVYGDRTAQTPIFDRLAREGVVFRNAFCAAPSCTPSRLSIVSGQYPHRLGVGANHMVKLPKEWDGYPEILAAAGYFVGHTGKGCAPGVLGEGWEHDPAGPLYPSIHDFLAAVPDDSAFCLWVGTPYAHRPYIQNSGVTSGLRTESVEVPAYLPDTKRVRNDLLDYYFALRQLDEAIREVIDALDARDLAANTLFVVTADNGMPFPRAKANCYDAGVHVPLAVRWPAVLEPDQRRDDFVHLSDLAPTFLEVAGLEAPAVMTGKSLVPALTGKRSFLERVRDALTGTGLHRDEVFVERERHALGRGISIDPVGFQSYPIRGVRTEDFLYLMNLRPLRMPACDPPDYLDIDKSPSKYEVIGARLSADTTTQWYYELSCGRRPAEELYSVERDPDQIHNLAGDPDFAYIKRKLRRKLERWMEETGDPRTDPTDDRWDDVGYYYPQRDPQVPTQPAQKDR